MLLAYNPSNVGRKVRAAEFRANALAGARRLDGSNLPAGQRSSAGHAYYRRSLALGAEHRAAVDFASLAAELDIVRGFNA